MAEFAQNYGALIIASFSLAVSIGTFWAVWRGVNEWKKQKRVAFAERYADALYQRTKNIQTVLHQSLIDDLNNGTYTNDKISTMEKETFQVLHVEMNLLRIGYIFPDLKKDMYEFNNALNGFGQEVDKIVAKFLPPESISADRKEKLIMEIDKLFTKSVPTQRIDSIYEKIDKYLTAYIAKNLK